MFKVIIVKEELGETVMVLRHDEGLVGAPGVRYRLAQPIAPKHWGSLFVRLATNRAGLTRGRVRPGLKWFRRLKCVLALQRGAVEGSPRWHHRRLTTT